MSGITIDEQMLKKSATLLFCIKCGELCTKHAEERKSKKQNKEVSLHSTSREAGAAWLGRLGLWSGPGMCAQACLW